MARGGVSAPRIVVANGTYAITRRTSFRKLLWTPSSPAVHQGYLYALALAQQKTGVQFHHGQLLPTHEHLTVTPTRDNLPDFFRALHRESARYLQELLLASGYNAPESVWDKRQTHAMRLVDAGAQAAWMIRRIRPRCEKVCEVRSPAGGREADVRGRKRATRATGRRSGGGRRARRKPGW